MKSQKIVFFRRGEIGSTEAAKLLGKSKSTLYRATRLDLIPHERRGPDYVFKRSAIIKVQIAMSLPGDWTKNIEWAPEDLFEAKVVTPSVSNISIQTVQTEQQEIDKPMELFKIARKLKAMGERDLANQAALRSAEAM